MSLGAGGANIIKTGLMVRFRYLFLATTIFAITSFIIISNKGIDIISHRYDNIHSDERFTIYTEGCSIPALKALDKSIINLVKYPSGLSPCPNSTIALLGNNRNKIWIRYKSFQYYNITELSSLSCCYHSFYRPASIEDISSPNIDDRVKYEKCLRFNDSIDVRNEFVKVTCFVETKKMYQQYFLFAPKKRFTEHENMREIFRNKTGYNILILGIDAVSRLNFHRTMPKTASFLKKKGAVELMGYNKVGDNTFPNLIPMLLGIKDTELKKTCYPHSDATFDNCPFVWEWFKQAGYYTALGEDSSTLGTFNYVKMGFSNTPTDYYLHTFMHEAEKHVGVNKDFNSYLCMNEKYFYKVLLDYIEDLTRTLNNKRMFGFFWEVTMSHDYLNYPMTMDDDYVKLFGKLEASEYLNNTIIFFVSDHGIRWGEIRSTKQGRLEERLPFLYILTPPSFRKIYTEAYNNLKLNSKRLTTPFDVYATLSDLVDLQNVENGALAARSSKSYADDRSISMFLPIPGKRTCQSAGIDDHWCTCLREVALSKDDPKAIEAALILVEFLNSLLKFYPQCARLFLSEVLGVTEVQVGKPDKNEVSWTEYLVVVRTSPGDGMFEGTLRQNSYGQNWALAGSVSRLNLYGEQSRCVHQYQMKLYCFCDK